MKLPTRAILAGHIVLTSKQLLTKKNEWNGRAKRWQSHDRLRFLEAFFLDASLRFN